MFGAPDKMKRNQLPTRRAVGCHFLAIKLGISNPSNKDIAKTVANEVCEIWATASIPTMPVKSVSRLIYDMMTTAQEMKHKKANSKAAGRVRDGLDLLFDICSCHCAHFAQCTGKHTKVNPWHW
jgi:hypothetical protein